MKRTDLHYCRRDPFASHHLEIVPPLIVPETSLAE